MGKHKVFKLILILIAVFAIYLIALQFVTKLI